MRQLMSLYLYKTCSCSCAYCCLKISIQLSSSIIVYSHSLDISSYLGCFLWVRCTWYSRNKIKVVIDLWNVFYENTCTEVQILLKVVNGVFMVDWMLYLNKMRFLVSDYTYQVHLTHRKHSINQWQLSSHYDCIEYTSPQIEVDFININLN
jgi:hypothetical protein